MAGKLLMVDAVTLFKSKGLKKSLAAIDPSQRAVGTSCAAGDPPQDYSECN